MSNYTMPQFQKVYEGKVVKVSIHDLIKEQLEICKNALQERMGQYSTDYTISIYNYIYQNDHIHIKLACQLKDKSKLEINLKVTSTFLQGSMGKMFKLVSDIGNILKDKETLNDEEVEQIKAILLEQIGEPFIKVDYTK